MNKKKEWLEDDSLFYLILTLAFLIGVLIAV